MVKFSNIPNAMQCVINNKHYLITKDKDFSSEEAALISKHLGLVISGKSSKQNGPTTTQTFKGK